MLRQIKRTSFSYRSLVAREPSLWLLYQPYLFWGIFKRSKVAKPRERIVHSKTELVIDGFQGSANSFLTYAFKDSQTSYIELTHHLHSPSQLIQAVKAKIPVILTIREPIGTILSLTRRWPHISANQGLKSYIKFYRKLEPYKQQMVISTFQMTTENPDEVIIQVNSKYGTSFHIIDANKANQDRLLRKQKSQHSREMVEELKKLKREEINLPKNAELLNQAIETYHDFLS